MRKRKRIRYNTTLYNVLTKESIEMTNENVLEIASKLEVSISRLWSLASETTQTLKEKYILSKNKHLIFTLVDLDTNEEFDCLFSFHISDYLGKLRSQSTVIAVNNIKIFGGCSKIYNRRLCLKGHPKPRTPRIFRSDGGLYKRLSNCCRKRIGAALKSKSLQKSEKTFNLIGCSPDFLRKYLESKFQDGMTWENWGRGKGKWQIDHIMPLSKVDLSDKDELHKVCHYTNLQPLWQKDNIRKSNKLDWNIL